MSLDVSLKGKSTLERHRKVLRRGERLLVLADADRWEEGKGSVFGLVKVAHRKVAASKKAAKTAETAEGAVAGAAPAAGAAAPAAGAKAAAAAPAAKGKK